MTVRVRCPKHSPEIDGIVLSSTHVIILKARKGILYVDGTQAVRGPSNRAFYLDWSDVGASGHHPYVMYAKIVFSPTRKYQTESEVNMLLLSCLLQPVQIRGSEQNIERHMKEVPFQSFYVLFRFLQWQQQQRATEQQYVHFTFSLTGHNRVCLCRVL